MASWVFHKLAAQGCSEPWFPKADAAGEISPRRSITFPDILTHTFPPGESSVNI